MGRFDKFTVGRSVRLERYVRVGRLGRVERVS